jgi:calmodulin-lysine N-methyltransferase
MAQMEVDTSTKARLRWKILRAALFGKAYDKNEENAIKMASIHSFPGFCLLDRRIIDLGFIHHADSGYHKKECDPYDILEYRIPIRCEKHEELVVIRTREKRDHSTQERVDIRSLVSENIYGVDNTSNVKVWDSEGILTFCLMRRKRQTRAALSPLLSACCISLDYFCSMATHCDSNVANKSKILRVIELGCGMAGIAGLAMACLENCCPELFHDIHVQVVLTDGHPDAVRNNDMCASLTTNKMLLDHRHRPDIKVCKLLWNESKDGATDCAQLTQDYKNLFQLLFVSDCLHFTNFHVALACTVGRLLDVNGLAIFCQPCRGKSLEQFVRLIQAINGNLDSFEENLTKTQNNKTRNPLFEINLLNDYDDVVTNLHQQFNNQHEGFYQPAAHYPLMLLLKKLRHYNEMSDTQTAIYYSQYCGKLVTH